MTGSGRIVSDDGQLHDVCEYIADSSQVIEECDEVLIDPSDSVSFGIHGYGEFNPRKGVGPARWSFFDLLWVHAGRVSLIIHGHTVELSRGRGLLIYPDTAFEGRAVSTSARASVQHFALPTLGGGRRASLPSVLESLRSRRDGYCKYVAADVEVVELLIDRALELSLLPDSLLVGDLRRSQLVQILGQLELDRLAVPSPGPRRDDLTRLVESLRQHPERSRCIAEMADTLGLSPSHFRSVFRQRMGVSAGRFQQQLRLREAARRLRDTNDSIKSIAQALRFSDLPHLHRQFKAEFGATPKQYRHHRQPRG